MQEQRRADADRRAVDPGDDGLGHGRQCAHEAHDLGGEPVRAARGRQEIGDVVAGGEDAARAEDGVRGNARIAIARIECVEHGGVHRAGQRVALWPHA